jgi:hypothetical protein
VRLRGIDLSTERTIAASPVWVRLVDTFTRLGPTGRIEVQIERRDANQWHVVTVPYLLKPSGDLALVNFGRVRRGEAGQQFDLRITATAEGSIAETVNGTPSVELTVTTWSADAPPALPTVQEIRCYPAPDHHFGSGIPLLSGVVDRAGNPVGRARVRSTRTVAGNTLTEEVRTNDDGWFRLPLRWSSGATQIEADRSGATGSSIITVPADLESVLRIPIS